MLLVFDVLLGFPCLGVSFSVWSGFRFICLTFDVFHGVGCIGFVTVLHPAQMFSVFDADFRPVDEAKRVDICTGDHR